MNLSFYKKALISSVIILACGASTSIAETDLYVSGAGKLIPIALPKFCLKAGRGDVGEKFPAIVKKDLDISGLFNVIDDKASLEGDPCKTPIEGVEASDWSIIGVDGVARGEVEKDGDSVVIKVMFHDLAKKTVGFGKEYKGDVDDLRAMAHKFANEIVKYYTGEAAFFGSKIAYSSKIGRFKELYVVDSDGENVEQLTNDKSLSLSPGWNPDGTKLVFTSYRKRTPDLFSVDIRSRRLTQFSTSRSLEVGPRFSRNGFGMLLSVTSERDTDLFLLNDSGEVQRKLTPQNGAIDVSADWSPDGRKIVFCSNRGGNPQIYTMDVDGGRAQRISFTTSNYCTSPVWSPKGDMLAFVCRFDGGFQIFTSDPDGEHPRQLTSYGDNEDPDWSPDGRWMVFSSNFGGGPFNLAIMKKDGTGSRQLTKSRSGDVEPAWGPVPK
jgi:TolB protein